MTQPTSGAGTGSAAYDASTSVPAAGRFVWHDLMTTDPARSLAFYSALLGWTTSTMEMGGGATYTMVHAGREGVGGIVPLDPSHGVPSHWVAYVTVDSVDAASERAAAAGGTVCVPPTDIPDVGRFAVVEDPLGTVLSPFTFPAGETPPEPTGTPVEGAFCWDELTTSDVERAKAFHATVFGWSYDAHPMGPDMTYWIAKRGAAQAGGLMQLPAEQLPPRPSWTPYIAVNDVDASTARAAELGGQVVVQPTDIPNIGRFSMVIDPTGATFALFRGNEE